MDTRGETAALIEDRPELEDAIEEVLAVDERRESWTFQDVPCDSGVFGEIASSAIVEKGDDGTYRVVDPDAVRAALDGESGDPEPTVTDRFDLPAVTVPRPDRLTVVALCACLSLVVVMRSVPFEYVFQGSNVVLTGNDPHWYRYSVERLTRLSDGPFDIGLLLDIPPGIASNAVLYVVSMWFVTELLGGTVGVAGVVLGLYPVAAAVATAGIVYLLATKLTDDVRVGLAAVALLAVTPVHATRTGLGFADHHAFDYLLLAAVSYCLVALTEDRQLNGPTGLLAVAFGVAVSAQTLAWHGSPLFLLPLAACFPLVSLSAVRAGTSPARRLGPSVAGLGVAAALTYSAHEVLGWHDPFVALTPALVFAGAAVVTAGGELAHRYGLSARSFAGAELAGLAVVAGVVSVSPVFGRGLVQGVGYFSAARTVAESQSLVSGSLGLFIAPALWLGFGVFLAVPYMCILAWRGVRTGESTWLVPLTYGWYLLAMSLLKIRFGGALAVFAAVFGGLGFGRLAAWVDLAELPGAGGRDDGSTPDELAIPSRREFLSLGVLSAGVGSFGLLFTPTQHLQLRVDPEHVEAAEWMRSFSDRRDLEFPSNYVFSMWDTNLYLNYVVNRTPDSYGFAKGHFAEFVTSADGTGWYERLSDRNRAGFVVTADEDLSDSADLPTDALHRQLHDEYGLTTRHYRLRWMSDDSSVKVFTPVPGAVVTGSAEPGTTFDFEHRNTIDGRTVRVSQQVSVNEFGVYSIELPQPGSYTVNGETVTVPERAVTGGGVVSQFDGDGTAYWSFDENDGAIAHDRVGGYHAQLGGDAGWTAGVDGPGLRVQGAGYAQSPLGSSGSFSLSLWVRPSDRSTPEGLQILAYSDGGLILSQRPDGTVSFRLPGTDGDHWWFGGIERGSWNHVVVTFDGDRRVGYVNGELADESTVEAGGVGWDKFLRIGGKDDRGVGFVGGVDEARFYDRALSRAEVESVFEQAREDGT